MAIVTGNFTVLDGQAQSIMDYLLSIQQQLQSVGSVDQQTLLNELNRLLATTPMLQGDMNDIIVIKINR